MLYELIELGGVIRGGVPAARVLEMPEETEESIVVKCFVLFPALGSSGGRKYCVVLCGASSKGEPVGEPC